LLDQDRARAFERGLRIRHARVLACFRRKRFLEETRRFALRVQGGIREQCLGERLEARFASDLRFRAALRLVRQVQVFESLFGFARLDAGPELRSELLLLFDARENLRAAGFELTQIPEPLFQRTELCVIEAAGRFLAVPRDEGNRGTFIEQSNGGGDLLRLGGELCGDARFDRRQQATYGGVKESRALWRKRFY